MVTGFCPLASGSKGNAIFIGTPKTKILIDAGISCKQIEVRLQRIGVSLRDIDAIFITHEHMDHIQGLKGIEKKYAIPVIANIQTAKGIYQQLHVMPTFYVFTTDETFSYVDIEVHPFTIQHDTLDPIAFVLKACQKKIGICTDLGFVSSHVVKNLEGCHLLYLEANHQEEMLMASPRPLAQKQRVLGRQGHLSNQECADLLSTLYHPQLEKLYLAHLSQECNAEDRALEIIKKKLPSSLSISIALQDSISDFTSFS
jgi:phosphoribosyl 1,2-cyclic phosphodiesterase